MLSRRSLKLSSLGNELINDEDSAQRETPQIAQHTLRKGLEIWSAISVGSNLKNLDLAKGIPWRLFLKTLPSR